MRRWGVLLALWLGVWPALPGLAAGAADAALAQASAALAGGQYPEAVTLATGGLGEAGLDALLRSRLLVVRGLSQQAQGRTDEALVDFTEAMQGAALQGEERARALFARGLSLDGAGRLKEAIGDYSGALKLAPGATYALNNRGNAYRRQGSFELARRDYAAALSPNNPNLQYPFFGLGQIAEAEGDLQSARDFYSRALAADPGFQLALERVQAMGPPAEGIARPDTGRIILRPPPPRPDKAGITLQPPREPAAVAPALQPVSPALQPVSPALQPVSKVQAARAPRAPSPDRSPLRPAIIASSKPDGPLVQLGAWRSDTEARAGWALAQDMAGDILADASPLIIRAELPGRGVYYRLRIVANGPVSQFCAVLMEKGQACIPARD
jgi:tetratricopeptide (TPR) repeat protein